jgi:hypothetical protein
MTTHCPEHVVVVLDPARNELVVRSGGTELLRLIAPSITIVDLEAVTDWLSTLESTPCPATT